MEKPMPSESAGPPVNPPRFEVVLRELEATLRELEDGGTTLDDALAKYEKGVSLIRTCYAALGSAEQRIKELTGIGPDGKPEFKDFTHTAAVERPKSTRRNAPPSDDSEY
jgi:exodeoxyribonuclease VII small subunit